MNAQSSPSRAAARSRARRNGNSRAAAASDAGAASRQRRRGPAADGNGRGETPKARGERTRRRVADALVDLLEAGDPAPTAKAVAAHASVSVRLVFHHFEDMESLYRTVLALQTAQYWDTVRPVPADRPQDERVDHVVQQRAKLFDAIGSVRRAGVTLAPRQPEIAEHIADADARLRAWLEETFAPELRSAGREKRELLSALDTAASWEAWDHMRRVEHLSAAAARRVMARTLRSLLA